MYHYHNIYLKKRGILAFTMEQHDFNCARCGESFSRKDVLVNHLKRKKACIATLSQEDRDDLINALKTKQYNDKTFDCNFCGKKFNQASCKSRHKKICKKNPSNSKATEDTPSSASNIPSSSTVVPPTYVIIEKGQLEYMMKKIEELDKHVQGRNSSNATGNVTTTNINNGTNYNISINLNSFGQEDVSHLSSEFLSHCILNPTKGLPSLIENIHYNKQIPSNHNIRCKSLKNNVFEKYVNSEWRACDASNTLDELIKKGYRILNAHYSEHFMNDPDIYEDENKQRVYEKFRFLSDKTCHEYYAVKRELRLVVKDRTAYLLESPSEDDIISTDDDTISNIIALNVSENINENVSEIVT